MNDDTEGSRTAAKQFLRRFGTQGGSKTESTGDSVGGSDPAAPIGDARVKDALDHLDNAIAQAQQRTGNADAETAEQLKSVAAQGLRKLATEGAAAKLSTAERLGLEAVIAPTVHARFSSSAKVNSTGRASRSATGTTP